jgi:microcin C transport system permease protein
MSALPERDALPPDPVPADPGARPKPPETVFRKRWKKFRSLKRGWYSFLLLTALFLLSFLNPVLINNKPLVLSYEGALHFPAAGAYHEAKDFGQRVVGEARYRELDAKWTADGSANWMVFPPYPYHPNESLLRDPTLPGPPPHSPSLAHWLGTDDRGRDVFARLVYGFRISILFGLGVVIASYLIGVTTGALLGFYGGRFDMFGQRLVEIWAGIPFLYTVIIISSIVRPSLPLLVFVLALFGWIGISAYVRGEFYREKARDYVTAAVATGESNARIIFRHILPNALTPVISFAPFSLVGSILSLVSLDFLGFGVREPTPSWGELVKQGRENIFEWHLVVFPLLAMFGTLVMVVFIGEAVREAFDPRPQSRLR